MIFFSKILTTAKLIGLVPTIIVIIASVLQWDAVSITAFVLFIGAGAVCRVWALVQGNTGTLKTDCTFQMLDCSIFFLFMRNHQLQTVKLTVLCYLIRTVSTVINEVAQLVAVDATVVVTAKTERSLTLDVNYG